LYLAKDIITFTPNHLSIYTHHLIIVHLLLVLRTAFAS